MSIIDTGVKTNTSEIRKAPERRGLGTSLYKGPHWGLLFPRDDPCLPIVGGRMRAAGFSSVTKHAQHKLSSKSGQGT